MRRTLTLVVAVVLLCGPATSVQAAPAPDRTRLISNRLHVLWMAGAPDAVRFATVEREFGIDILNAPRQIEAQDTKNEVVATSIPVVWYDSFARYPYGASASFQWKYTCGKSHDEACWLQYGGSDPADQGDLGGDDGFALKIDTDVKTQGGGFTLHPNCNDADLFYDQSQDSSPYGIGYRKPDHVDLDPRHCGDKSDNREYSWDSGEIGVNFAPSDPCRRPVLFVVSKFGHSWEKTNLTGFTIGVESIGIQWENKGHDLDAFPTEGGSADCYY